MRQEAYRQHEGAAVDQSLTCQEGARRSSSFRPRLMCTAAVLMTLLAANSGSAQQKKYSAEELLKSFVPSQKGVEYDTPNAADMAKCQVSLEKGSYVITGPANEVLRRFTDSNGDSAPDMFRYYHLGLEVYRDIVTKKGGRPDQFRWMNWGGTRWGIDQDGDGKIDIWKVISAQEASRVAVEALINGDLQALRTVMISDADIAALKVPAAIAKQLQEATADLQKKATAAVSNTKVLNARSQWVRFDASLPGLVLAEDMGTSQDITVYENAMAYVQNGEKLDLISIGEIIQIGDVWKLVTVPAPLDTSGSAMVTIGGIMMQPRTPAGQPDSSQEMPAEMQKLLADLQKLDEASPRPDAPAQAFVNYNVQRANLSEKLISLSRNDEERQQWIQQFTDSLSTATQSGLYPEGLPRLVQLQAAAKSNQSLLGYIYYRRLMAEYAVRLKEDDKAKAEEDIRKARESTQKWWFEQLEAFAKQWPNSEDAPDAVVQLAISYELMGRIDDARAWYAELAKNYPETEGGVKARGALRRLTLTGQKLDLAGTTLQGQKLSSRQYAGKVTLVVFWASYAQPFTDDLTAIKAAYAKYQKSGFEILGVNMDTDLTAVGSYLKAQGITWQNLREAPSQDGQQPGDYGFGIVSVPTMFLVNKDGTVEGGITAANLDYAVDALIQGKKLETTPAQGNAATTPEKTSQAENSSPQRSGKTN
jgi:tetratricopeptide (TPR) repeat protein